MGAPRNPAESVQLAPWHEVKVTEISSVIENGRTILSPAASRIPIGPSFRASVCVLRGLKLRALSYCGNYLP